MKAARMFDEGRTQAEVARELGVSWRAAHDWHGAWKSGGREALVAGRKPGQAPKFDNGEMARLEIALREGALAHGYDNDLWTLRRVGRLVGDLFWQEGWPVGGLATPSADAMESAEASAEGT